MPKQETFLVEEVNDIVVEVFKTYDTAYAREVFENVDDEARKSLAAALEIEKNFATEEIPDPAGQDYEDFLWDELSEASLEDVRQSPKEYSFFIVTETIAGKSADVYISADWPSAEAFAKKQIAKAS